ncbi:alpha-(1,3)-fucosyltransferase 7-like [Mya arenaria]|uniref:alpha-(1,3)-fucosyltransferase 7-like n=1 Tax=Mya arenaria TaxID=6604 RepID=UPI0022E2D81C|nr:alpha-(1,3)-fucosyltransferase 7-like [Mya arenaria]
MGRYTRKICLKIFVLILIVVLLSVIYLKSSKDYSGVEKIVSFPNKHFRQKQVKKILHWTTFFEKPPDITSARTCLKTCDSRCEVTADKAEVQSADAVVFHLSDVWTKKWRIGTRSVVEFPRWRDPHQVWVLENLEPPPHLWGDLAILNGRFNWTRWYRVDADIHTPYGAHRRLGDQERQETSKLLQDRNTFLEKTGEAAAMISNCRDPGRRYRIVRELEKYINIEKFGSCYNTPCGLNPVNPYDTSCDSVLKQFKFYFAFENDHCKDYVTEKYWHALDRDQIPIVNWKHVYEDLVIPHSYINIYDFDSLQTAGQYIRKVSQDENLYNSYFHYRQYYTKAERTCSACKLCQDLHNKSKPAQVYRDLDAWVRDDVCEKAGVWNNIVRNVHSLLFFKLGI